MPLVSVGVLGGGGGGEELAPSEEVGEEADEGGVEAVEPRARLSTVASLEHPK